MKEKKNKYLVIFLVLFSFLAFSKEKNFATEMDFSILSENSISKYSYVKSVILIKEKVDEPVDVFDLCRVKQQILSESISSEETVTTCVLTEGEQMITTLEETDENDISLTSLTENITIETTVPNTTSKLTATEMTTTTPQTTTVVTTTIPPQITVTTTEATIPEYIMKNVKEKGIDVSVYQGIIDWKTVKASGIDFAILRAGYGGFSYQKDKNFEINYANAKANGIKVGAYWYSYAKTLEQSNMEVDAFLSVVSGKQFEYPVYFDIEDKSQENLGVDLLTNITINFCEKVQSRGYYVGLYTNMNWITYKLDKSRLVKFDKWFARWSNIPPYGNEFGGLWQYSSTGKVNGISGPVDLNYSYRDYATIIKTNHLNGF